MSDADSAAVGAVAAADPQPGRTLADARAARNLSVAEVAQQLKLSVAQVEALEADAYDRLPGPVFVRGFVRNYARVLELDGDRLVAALDLSHEPAPAGAAISRSQNIPFPEQRPPKRWGYAVGLLVLVSAVVLFEIFFSAPQPVVVSPPLSQPAAAPVVAAPVPAPGLVTETVVAAPPVAAVPAAAAVESVPAAPAATPPAAPATKSAAAPAAAKRADAAEVHFVFQTQAWVEVRDRNGRVLLSQLNPAGAEQRLRGRPPLSVVVGNAQGVRLTVNNQPFDLAPHTRAEVARFTLE